MAFGDPADRKTMSPGGESGGRQMPRCTPFSTLPLSGHMSAAAVSTAGQGAYLMVMESDHLWMVSRLSAATITPVSPGCGRMKKAVLLPT